MVGKRSKSSTHNGRRLRNARPALCQGIIVSATRAHPFALWPQLPAIP